MFKEFNYNEIKPTGWLKKQLQIQADGLSGNLDKVWVDIRESAWIGGSAEGWERVPYWLDGFIPLAYLLDDKDKISRAEKYINAIIARQKPDGWICPCEDSQRKSYDVWAVFLIGKVLALYCNFSQRKDAESSLYRAMKCCYDMMKKGEITLFEWGKFRWFECFIPLSYLYEKNKEEWILDFARLLRAQGADYASFTELYKEPLNEWRLETHMVNIAMMFKCEALCADLLGESYKGFAEKMWSFLYKYNSTAVGTFTGDECLGGIGNNRGTELCSVVELMYSCEILYKITGKRIWADRLEKAAFNALPATISDDMCTHQYDQQVNQIGCVPNKGKPPFGTNGSDAHIFGLEPFFGCCTSNFNQGWPKLALNIFRPIRNGVECAHLLPAILTTQIKSARVTIEIETDYPFKHTAKISVNADKAVNFTLKIRVPFWSKGVTVNGKEADNKGYITLNKLWNNEEISIELHDAPHFVSRPKGMKVIEYGALVFANPIKVRYEAQKPADENSEKKFPYCDYYLYPESDWQYGFAGSEIQVIQHKIANTPFSSANPPITLKTKLCPVRWELQKGYSYIAAEKPASSISTGKAVERELYPYGCAKLRITEMPICKIKEK